MEKLPEFFSKVAKAPRFAWYPCSPPLSENVPHSQQGERVSLESKEEPAAKRIALFRNLFRGRQDVYSRR